MSEHSYYLVMTITPAEELFELEIGGTQLHVDLKPDPEQPQWYAPVYDSREKAERAHPGKTVLEVRKV